MKKAILLLSAILTIVQFSFAQSQGPNNPGTAASSSTGCLACPGSIWGNPTYVMLSDNQTASTTVSPVGSCFQSTCFYSRELLMTNFGFSIPTSNISVTGIKVEIQRNAFSANVVKDTIVKLLLSGSAIGNNMALAPKWGITSNYYTYGGSSNLWGATILPADVNDPTFGVSLKISNTATTNQSAYVDHVRMTVYYTTTTGITSSVTSDRSMSAYFNDQRMLSLSYKLDKDSRLGSIAVYNMLGQNLFSQKMTSLSAGNHQEEINVGSLNAGVYVVRMITDQGETTRKITVK